MEWWAILWLVGLALVLVFNYAAGKLNEKADRDRADLLKRMHDYAERPGMDYRGRDFQSARSGRKLPPGGSEAPRVIRWPDSRSKPPR